MQEVDLLGLIVGVLHQALEQRQRALRLVLLHKQLDQAAERQRILRLQLQHTGVLLHRLAHVLELFCVQLTEKQMQRH